MNVYYVIGWCYSKGKHIFCAPSDYSIEQLYEHIKRLKKKGREGWRYESPISANIEMMAKVYQTKHPEHTLKVGNVYNRITQH